MSLASTSRRPGSDHRSAAQKVKSFTKTAAVLAAAAVSGALLASTAHADPMVTYSWTTTSQGYGPHVGQPSLATFQVPLADVLSGTISFADVTNIQLAYPGISFNTASVSITGFDFAAYVNPLTGAFIYKDHQEGFAVIASDSTDPNFSTFLSITVDNPYDPYGTPLTSVKDQFNALNHGTPYAGFPTAGFWSAAFPSTPVPLPPSWTMMAAGLVGLGIMAYRRKPKAAL